jgi:hypothetical protein
VYARKIEGKVYTFGVSGNLYRSNVLMYDHQTESLWLQVKREAVTGPMTGNRLRTLRSTITTWAKWKKRHPDTRVLTTDTGHRRNYEVDPYADYYKSRRGLFSRFFRGGPGEEAKALVAGFELGGKYKAYPMSAIREKGELRDLIGDREIRITFDRETDTLTARTGDGTEIIPIVAYWFVWKGIHPATERYGDQAQSQ